MRILKFKSYFPQGKRLVIDGKSEVSDGKGVSAPQKRSEVFHCDECVTYCVTYFVYIDHVIYTYVLIHIVNFCKQFFYFLLFDYLFFFFNFDVIY